MPSIPGRSLRVGYFFKCPSNVNRPGTSTRLGRPRYGPIKRPVDLKDSGSVPIILKTSSIAVWQSVSREADQVTRGYVTKNDRCPRQFFKRFDSSASNDFSSTR